MHCSRRHAEVPEPEQGKPEGKKLRRKLQKLGPKHRSWFAGKSPVVVSNLSLQRSESERKESLGDDVASISPPVVVVPPDLSDAKWLGYVRKSGYLSPMLQSPEPPKSADGPKNNIIPEFSHLAVKEDKARSSSETLLSDCPASPVSALRRQAKTPVFAVGQLENASSERTDLPNPKRLSIAEQYQALLGPHDYVFADSRSNLSVMTDRNRASQEARQRHSSSDEEARDVHQIASRRASVLPGTRLDQPQISPTSSDGTVVAFEEEAIYFKPAALLGESSPVSLRPPTHRSDNHLSPFPSPSQPVPDNLGLQICVDLLTQELASVASERPSPPRSAGRKASSSSSSPELTALQIWVMIEAYERLRDQLSETRRGTFEDAGPLEAMFNTWLRALYNIHDSMAMRERGRQA